MFLYMRGRGSGCPLGLQLPCSRVTSTIDDGNGGCERWKIFGKIYLHDGSVPVIDLETSSKRGRKRSREVVEASITGLESAIWFKVLIVDTVCLDVETKCIQWTSCSIDECTERRQSSRPFCSCQHTHEVYIDQYKDNMTAGRDLERGLEIARSILNGSNDNEHQDVLLLLHVYVLPIIRLHASDRKHVSSALDTQVQVLAQLDEAIDKMTNERHDIKKTMKDWRQDICNQLTDERAIANCNIQFLKLLHEHLQNDLRNAYVELDDCQERVDTCKGSLTKKRGSQYISDLVEARKVRDRVADYINKALFVMEEVHLILSVTTLPERNQLTDQHRAYIQIQEECKRHSKELHDLQRKKLLATSVREALVSTESELKQGRDTTGIDVTSDGLVRSTDVLGPSNKLPQEWQTLPSRVSEALEKNKTLQELHHEFSDHVISQCKDEIKGQPSIKRLRPRLDVSSWKKLGKKHSGSSNSSIGSNHGNQLDRVRRSARSSLKEKKPTAHFQAVTQTIKANITHHFHEVCRLLASHLNLQPQLTRSDLWTCYERAFYPGKISELIKLYVYAYEEETKYLQKVLPTSSLQDMKLDDEWILNILGLYAPHFSIHSEVEVGVEVTAPADTLTHAVIETVTHGIDTQSEEDVVGLKVKDSVEGEEPLIERVSDALKEKLNVEDDIRGRLESGVEVDLPEDKLRHHSTASQKDTTRQSWRNTQIIDFRWVTVPIDIEEGQVTQSVPCIMEKQKSLENVREKEHEVASRHSSCPDITYRKQAAREQYSNQPVGLVGNAEKPVAIKKKDRNHLEDQIGDDSGVFNDHQEEAKCNKEGDLNSNILDRREQSNKTDVHSDGVTISTDVPEEGNPHLDKQEEDFPTSELAASSDTASEVEKMSLHSLEPPASDSDVNIMVQGVNGEVKLDRELSRRCREKPAIAEFLRRFSQAYHYFRVVLEESVPTSKLQWLLRCLKEVNTIAEQQARVISCGKQRMLSGDDLLTSLILFLIHGDPGEVTAFYPQLRFLEDYIPDFLDKGEIGFAVIQFESAYSYILRVKREDEPMSFEQF
ncbi:uncharacterized protein [Diadema antillarum]|uniref:uncharacterized protein n=1 Tax=Diadema antillarum TaxID=105358 RepID=UPI003A844CA3